MLLREIRDREQVCLERGRGLDVRPVPQPVLARVGDVDEVGAEGAGLAQSRDDPVCAEHQRAVQRRAPVTVGGYATALMLVRGSDLIATVPERHTGVLRKALVTLSLPFAMDPVTVSLLWHPRMDADPAHRWLRDSVRAACSGSA